jgi:hypothetical protein
MAHYDEQEWRRLCERAAIETDPQTLVELAEQINSLLELREKKLRQPISADAQEINLRKINSGEDQS